MPRKVRSKDFVCHHENCDAVFNRKDRLESHLLVHDGERPFVCSFEGCGKSYTRSSHLKRHENTHKINFCCSVETCKAILKSKETLQKHMDIVHFGKKKKTYECTICNASFNKHCWLQKHMYRHTGIRPYLCPVENCNRRFLVPNKLRKHLAVHDGYTCSEPNCGRNFPTWGLYVKHFKVYHAVVHKCGICDKVFSSATNLRCHEALHSNEREVFICPKPYCTRFYFAKKNLRQHIKSYHDKRPFTCTNEICQKSFSSEALLTSHQRDHDPNKPMRKKRKKKRSFAAFLAGCVTPKGKSLCSKKEPTDSEASSSEELEKTNETEVENKSNQNIEENCEETKKCSDEWLLSENEDVEKVPVIFHYKPVPENELNVTDNEFDVHSCGEDTIVRES